MNGMSFEEIKKEIRNAIQMDYIEPADIPAIELYMDQVTTFMDKHLSNNKRTPDDKILTKTMINNYTKNHLLPPPEKKKYSKEHIILLIYTYYLKNFLSIGDIQKLLAPMIEQYFNASETDSTTLSSIYSTVVDLARLQYQMDKQEIFKTYEIVNQKIKEQHPELSSDAADSTSYLQDFTFVALLSYDIYLKTQLVEKIIDSLSDEQVSKEDANTNTDEKAKPSKEKTSKED